MADNLLTRFTERFFPLAATRQPDDLQKDSRVVIYGSSLIP